MKTGSVHFPVEREYWDSMWPLTGEDMELAMGWIDRRGRADLLEL